MPPDARVIALTRGLMSTAGLLIVTLTPLQMATPMAVAAGVFALYTLYAVVFYAAQASGAPWTEAVRAREHWLDVAWYTLIISLTEGTESIFFSGYYFPIVIASFRWGFAAGMRVTMACAALFITLGYVAAPPPPEFEVQHMLVRPIFLLLIGYVVASRGGYELRLRERMRFLKDIGTMSNPRFGVDRTIGILMHRLMRLYGAHVCAIVTHDPATGADLLRRIHADDVEGPVPPEAIPHAMPELLVRLPSESAVAYCVPDRARSWPAGSIHRRTRDASEWGAPADLASCEAMAELWDARAFVAVSMIFPRDVSARLILAFREKRQFDEHDVAFLVQAIEQAFPMIENIRLVDQLASKAAHEERLRIARDIHDSIIQPYVGLRMALAGLQHKVEKESPAVRREVDRLVDMTSLAVDDLRRQVSTLRSNPAPGEGLVPAITRFAHRYTEFTGIAVDVVAATAPRLDDRVAGEAFQMVAEGLSNVRRHTRATRATIAVTAPEGHLALRIENGGGEPGGFVPFLPRSIAERATALGGHVDVKEGSEGGACVTIEIPL